VFGRTTSPITTDPVPDASDCGARDYQYFVE
jgi:hypothetical protein